jgi:hypothetical protein
MKKQEQNRLLKCKGQQLLKKVLVLWRRTEKIEQFVKNTANANPTALQFLNNLEFSESDVMQLC